MSSAATPDGPTYKRRTYLVDRGFQLKYTAILMVVGASITALFGTMMYQAQVAATDMMNLPQAYKDVVSQNYDGHLIYIVAGIAVVMTLSLALFGVLIDSNYFNGGTGGDDAGAHGGPPRRPPEEQGVR